MTANSEFVAALQTQLGENVLVEVAAATQTAPTSTKPVVSVLMNFPVPSQLGYITMEGTLGLQATTLDSLEALFNSIIASPGWFTDTWEFRLEFDDETGSLVDVDEAGTWSTDITVVATKR